MAATHPAYNLMKMPGSSGVLTVSGDTRDALPTSSDALEPKVAALAKKKQLFTQDKAETKKVLVNKDGSTDATFTIGANLEPEQEKALVRFLRANKKVCPNVRPMKQKAR